MALTEYRYDDCRDVTGVVGVYVIDFLIGDEIGVRGGNGVPKKLLDRNRSMSSSSNSCSGLLSSSCNFRLLSSLRSLGVRYRDSNDFGVVAV